MREPPIQPRLQPPKGGAKGRRITRELTPMQAWLVDLVKPSTLLVLGGLLVGGITATSRVLDGLERNDDRITAVEKTIADGRDEREKAAAVVSALNTKIELLNQQNTQMNAKLDTWLQGISRRQEQTAADVSNLLREMLRMHNRPTP